MLAITCNNAMSNDRMVLELEDTVPYIDGQMACTWCFLHIGNVISKSLVKAFDLPSKESVDFDGTRDSIEEDDELEHLAGGLEVENWQTIAENGEDPTDTDDTEGWVNEIPLLTREEHMDLEDRVRPVQIAFAIMK